MVRVALARLGATVVLSGRRGASVQWLASPAAAPHHPDEAFRWQDRANFGAAHDAGPCHIHTPCFMRMLTLGELSLRPLAAPAAGVAPACQILRGAEPTGAVVAGAVLEAACEWQGFILLLTTDDVPSEEFLHIHLLGPGLQRVDSAMLGAMYSTGSFSRLPSPEPDTLRFRFIGDTDWSVQILPEPRFRPLLWSEPTGVSRPLGFSRHFVVRGNPGREGH
jgi:hypothetical protein